MLERLYIDNYRCLVNFECHFGPEQLLLGPNGSGKTTVFDILARVRDCCVGGAQLDFAFSGSTRTRWQNVPEQSFELDVSGNGGLYTFRFVVDSSGSPVRPRIVKEEVLFSGKPIFRFALGEVQLFDDNHVEKVKYPFDSRRSALAHISEQPENTKLMWFIRWLRSLLFINPDPRRMSGFANREDPGPAPDLSNFTAWYRRLRNESARDDQNLQSDLRHVIPGFEFMDLGDAGLNNKFIWLTFSPSSNNGQPHKDLGYGLDELSDGQRVLIALYTVLHFSLKPGVTLFFDEPDNFVALREIQPWLDKVLDQVQDAQSNKQVVFISHHPELLDRLALEGGLVFDRPENRHTRVRYFSDPAHTGLSPAELVARGWENE
jgi:predicted ATPase